MRHHVQCTCMSSPPFYLLPGGTYLKNSSASKQLIFRGVFLQRPHVLRYYVVYNRAKITNDRIKLLNFVEYSTIEFSWMNFCDFVQWSELTCYCFARKWRNLVVTCGTKRNKSQLFCKTQHRHTFGSPHHHRRGRNFRRQLFAPYLNITLILDRCIPIEQKFSVFCLYLKIKKMTCCGLENSSSFKQFQGVHFLKSQ